MTINGEPVCEIDIRASYLTIYHAHYGAPLDPERDPYDLPGLGLEARDVVKLWFVATFGNDGHLERWPTEMAADYPREARPTASQAISGQAHPGNRAQTVSALGEVGH